jgi:hypothetical protein
VLLRRRQHALELAGARLKCARAHIGGGRGRVGLRRGGAGRVARGGNLG